MVTPLRTWVYDVNHSVAGATQLLKYKDAVYRLKYFLVTGSGPWVVRSSSNGTTAGLSDNWSSSSDINPDTSPSARSWIEFTSPAGMVSGGTVHIVFDCDTSSASPVALKVTIATANPSAEGTTTARPTFTSSVTMTNTAFFQNNNNARNTHGLRTTVGDFVFFVAEDGADIAVSAVMGVRGDNQETGNTWPFALYYGLPATPKGAFDVDALTDNTLWTGLGPSGALVSTAVIFESAAHAIDNWIGGVSSATPETSLQTLIDLIVDSTSQGTYAGRVTDIRGALNSTPANSSISGETGTHRLISVGALWLPLLPSTTLVL